MGVRLLSIAVLFAFAVRAMERAMPAVGFGDKQPRGQRAQRENTQHEDDCQKRATESQTKRHCGENDCSPIFSQARTKKLHRMDGLSNPFRIIADGAPGFVGWKPEGANRTVNQPSLRAILTNHVRFAALPAGAVLATTLCAVSCFAPLERGLTHFTDAREVITNEASAFVSALARGAWPVGG